MPKTAERQLLQSNDCLPKRPEPRSVDSRTLCPEKVGRSSKLKSEYLLHTQACYTSAIRASEATSQREEKHLHGAEHPKTSFTDRHRARPDLVARGAPIISGSSHITSSARANPLCGGPPNADQADPPPPPAVLPTKRRANPILSILYLLAAGLVANPWAQSPPGHNQSAAATKAVPLAWICKSQRTSSSLMNRCSLTATAHGQEESQDPSCQALTAIAHGQTLKQEF